MGKLFDRIDDRLADFIARQRVFFVGTAPLDAGGHVNVSPKGHDTLRILDPQTIAYLDLTGSGIETVAHLRENARITIMLCAFEGPPRTLRLSGRGEVLEPGDAEFAALSARFPELPGVRSIVRVRLDRIADSCGFSIPLLAYQGERRQLIDYAERLGEEGLTAARARSNAASIDGLPGLRGAQTP